MNNNDNENNKLIDELEANNRDSNKNKYKDKTTGEINFDDFLKENLLSLTDFKLDEIVPEIENLATSPNAFDTDKSKYSLAYLSKLKEEKLIKEFDFGDEVEPISQAKIIELANLAVPIEFDNEKGEVYFIKDDGTKHYIIFSKSDEENIFTRKAVSTLLHIEL